MSSLTQSLAGRRLGIAAIFVSGLLGLMFASACSPTVEPGPSDAQIKRDVTAALDQAGLPTVAAQVNAGVVTLTGTVPDQASVDRAASVVRAVAGIKDVVNQITVDAGAAPPPPPIAIPESPDELTAAKRRKPKKAESKR